jgi:hypothetical protein
MGDNMSSYKIEPHADLRNANLCGANLCGANLCNANLCGANLRNANLYGADLRNADLRNADLHNADLRNADLCGANLCGANLRGANLRGANLRNAQLTDLQRAQLSIVPESGAFDGYKKLRNEVVAHVRIPAKAKRCSAPGSRKCRAEYVKVISGAGIASYDQGTRYSPGEIVRADKWDNDNWFIECTHGIHFFLTRAEAEAY